MRFFLLSCAVLLGAAALPGCGDDPAASSKNAAPLSLTKDQADAIAANDKAVEDDEHRPQPKTQAKAK